MCKAEPQSLQCPACRARQPLQNQCRRCQADLTLLARAQARVAWLIQQRDAVHPSDSDRRAIETELTRLQGSKK